MVTRLRDSQGLPDPVDGGVSGTEPGEPQDDVFLSTAHDVEEMFLDNSFNVGIEGASIVNCTGFVCGLVHVAYSNGGGDFLCGELVFSDKLPVYTRDVSTRVYQHGGVDDFKGV